MGTHFVGDVVDDDGGLCSAVVHGRQAVVALLACCVPDLKLDRCVVQTNRLGQEGSWEQQQTWQRITPVAKQYSGAH